MDSSAINTSAETTISKAIEQEGHHADLRPKLALNTKVLSIRNTHYLALGVDSDETNRTLK